MRYYLRLLNWPGVGEESINLVCELDGYRIFMITPSAVCDTSIKVQVSGCTVASYQHIAVDSENKAYIFDAKDQKILYALGVCEILEQR